MWPLNLAHVVSSKEADGVGKGSGDVTDSQKCAVSCSCGGPCFPTSGISSGSPHLSAVPSPLVPSFWQCLCSSSCCSLQGRRRGHRPGPGLLRPRLTCALGPQLELRPPHKGPARNGGWILLWLLFQISYVINSWEFSVNVIVNFNPLWALTETTSPAKSWISI